VSADAYAHTVSALDLAVSMPLLPEGAMPAAEEPEWE